MLFFLAGLLCSVMSLRLSHQRFFGLWFFCFFSLIFSNSAAKAIIFYLVPFALRCSFRSISSWFCFKLCLLQKAWCVPMKSSPELLSQLQEGMLPSFPFIPMAGGYQLLSLLTLLIPLSLMMQSLLCCPLVPLKSVSSISSSD